MNHLLLNIFASLVKTSDINPAFMDIAKIIAGSIIWIGGLTTFMWYKEKGNKRLNRLSTEK